MRSGRWRSLALLLVITCFATWKVDAGRYGKQLADLSAAHQADLTSIANAAAAQARQVLEKQQAIQKALAELDAKATKEKMNALAENEKLRADVAAGDRRLRIAGRIEPAIDKCRNIWASLPGAGYGQREHRTQDLLAVYARALKVLV